MMTYLQHVRPDIGLVAARDLDGLQDPGCEGVVVDPPAGPQSRGHDLRLRHQIHAVEVAHGLADLPAVDVLAVEVRFVSGVELGVGLLLPGRGHRSAGQTYKMSAFIKSPFQS